MGILDEKADVYLGLCNEFLVREYGRSGTLICLNGHPALSARCVAPDNGGHVKCFDVGTREWLEMEDGETNIIIMPDGKVFVSFPMEDEEHGGMSFSVEHPREVAELFHLIVHSYRCLVPGEEPRYVQRRLGDMAGFHALVHDGTTWRSVDLSAPPAGLPPEFVEAVRYSVIQDFDGFLHDKTFKVTGITERWPDAIRSLPDATAGLRSGYLLSPDGRCRPATELLTVPVDENRTYLDVLMIPKDASGASCLYLREMLDRDAQVGKAMRKAFEKPSSLPALNENLVGLTFPMPDTFDHQIRIAAENNQIREWLRHVAGCLADQRGLYFNQSDHHWHLAHSLKRMLATNRS